jgi:Mrp family chromosome partitioning ATPase
VAATDASPTFPPPATVIVIAGFQSRIGRTQVALQLTVELSARGTRVLQIDTDLQNAVAMALGVSNIEVAGLDGPGKTLSGALIKCYPW